MNRRWEWSILALSLVAALMLAGNAMAEMPAAIATAEEAMVVTLHAEGAQIYEGVVPARLIAATQGRASWRSMRLSRGSAKAAGCEPLQRIGWARAIAARQLKPCRFSTGPRIAFAIPGVPNGSRKSVIPSTSWELWRRQMAQIKLVGVQ
jgi:hypothetical protein